MDTKVQRQPMKILFLSIDGVLNTVKDYLEQEKSGALNEKCVERLHRIVKETDCVIVITCDWRMSEICMTALKKAGFYRFDTVAKDNVLREQRILNWINNPDPEHQSWLESGYTIAVVDSHVHYFDLIEDCNLFFVERNVGLTDEDADRIISHLNAE